jgi:hypothetical protein
LVGGGMSYCEVEDMVVRARMGRARIESVVGLCFLRSEEKGR